jgi:RNA polymerase sigma factor (sigma-70 family)
MTTTTSSPDTARSTTDLLGRACDRDPQAWDEIMRRYSGVVWAKIRSFGLQEADALDALQTTWLRLAENCHQIQFPEQLAGWLATTASRECLRILRYHALHTPTSHEVAAPREADPSMSPEQHAIDTDTAARLWRLVATLPTRRQRLIRELFLNDPRPYTEIARTTGIPAGGIGPTRARALTQLRRRLDEHELGRRH